MKRIVDGRIEAVDTTKRRRVDFFLANGSLPPNWLQTWDLPEWLVSKDGRTQQGTNMITRWTRNEEGEWIREGTDRWKSICHDLEEWIEDNETLAEILRMDPDCISTRGSLPPKTHDGLSRCVLQALRTRQKRPVCQNLRDNVPKETLLIYLYWCFDVFQISYFLNNAPFSLMSWDEACIDVDRKSSYNLVIQCRSWGRKSELAYGPANPYILSRPNTEQYFTRGNTRESIEVAEDALLLFGSKEEYVFPECWNNGGFVEQVDEDWRKTRDNYVLSKETKKECRLAMLYHAGPMLEQLILLWLDPLGEVKLSQSTLVKHWDTMISMARVVVSSKDVRVRVGMEVILHYIQSEAQERGYRYETCDFYYDTFRHCGEEVVKKVREEERQKTMEEWLFGDAPYGDIQYVVNMNL